MSFWTWNFFRSGAGSALLCGLNLLEIMWQIRFPAITRSTLPDSHQYPVLPCLLRGRQALFSRVPTAPHRDPLLRG